MTTTRNEVGNSSMNEYNDIDNLHENRIRTSTSIDTLQSIRYPLGLGGDINSLHSNDSSVDNGTYL